MLIVVLEVGSLTQANVFFCHSSLLNCRPKLCLEKCDANMSNKASTIQTSQTTTTDTTITDDSPVVACHETNNYVDLTTDEDKQTKAEQPIANSLDIKVLKQYEHILQRPAFVKLIKYDNIEKDLKTSTGSRTHSNRYVPQ